MTTKTMTTTDARGTVMLRVLRDPIVLLIFGVALAYVGTNAVMFWVSLRQPTDLVTADYYAQSKRIDERQAEERASAESGWRIAAMEKESDRDTLLFQVRDAAGMPVTGLTGEAHAYRPSDSGLDQALTLSPVPDRPGTFSARFARPRSGLWEVNIALSGRDHSVRERVRFVAP